MVGTLLQIRNNLATDIHLTLYTLFKSGMHYDGERGNDMVALYFKLVLAFS